MAEMPVDAEFFEAPEEWSVVKSRIVLQYFSVWSTVMARQSDRIGYFDFYCGPGRYDDGTLSTPLLVLKKAISSPELSKRLVTIFNDVRAEFTQNLESEIAGLEDVGELAYEPRVYTGELSDDVVAELERVDTVPSLSFIDPWGYKGLSSRLIQALIKAYGCDVIFFFNYNRINMGIRNPKVRRHMEALFGSTRLEALQEEVQGALPVKREEAITRALEESVTALGAPHVLPFTFRRDDGRVSHYICFVSKHQLGYSIMKTIMAKESIVDEDNVPLYEYVPSGRPRQLPLVPERPLLDLPVSLQDTFGNRTLSVKDIYEQHHVGTPFIKPNYKRVLILMESRREIQCDRSADKRRKGTIADDVIVTFPPG